MDFSRPHNCDAPRISVSTCFAVFLMLVLLIPKDVKADPDLGRLSLDAVDLALGYPSFEGEEE